MHEDWCEAESMSTIVLRSVEATLHPIMCSLTICIRLRNSVIDTAYQISSCLLPLARAYIIWSSNITSQ